MGAVPWSSQLQVLWDTLGYSQLVSKKKAGVRFSSCLINHIHEQSQLPKKLMHELTYEDAQTSARAAHKAYLIFKQEKSHLASDTFLDNLATAIAATGHGKHATIVQTLKIREQV